MQYYVYLIQCVDKSLYCGYTTDIKRRVSEHNYGDKGAKYTKARRPVALVYSEEFQSLSAALKREHEIKKLSRTEKKALIPNEKGHEL